MLKFCKQNQENVINKIINNEFDSLMVSRSNLVDDIISKIYDLGLLKCLAAGIGDKRADNTVVPFELILTLAVAAKMKTHTSVCDIPYAIEDHSVLSKLGCNLIDNETGLRKGLTTESNLRFLLGKYSGEYLFEAYNTTIQNYIFPKLDIETNIHILDCTEISVNLDNNNYEQSSITLNKYGDVDRGYKLGTLRGICDDSGVIEHIVFGAMNVHDLELSRDMIYNSPVLKEGDILIEDRGFIDRDTINYLKNKRGVDTFIPLKSNMVAYQIAVSDAQNSNNWVNHPFRKNEKIALVTDLGPLWESENPNEDVPFNGAVVWDTETNNYFVFISTDTTISAKQIVKTYEIRPEIEEDYRQLKDFWMLEDFKSTKYNIIAFHIITVLFGYLFFQIYTSTPEGEKYAHKCLPVILKNYQSNEKPHLIFYADNEFAIISIIELYDILPKCNRLAEIRLRKLLN